MALFQELLYFSASEPRFNRPILKNGSSPQ